MASTITIKAGQNPLVFTGTTALVLASEPWYTSDNVDKISTPTTNNQGFTNGKPGTNFGVTQLPVAIAGQRRGVVIVAKQDFTVPTSLFGPLAKPVISSLGPTSRAPGDLLTITGTDLDTAVYVIIGLSLGVIDTASLTATALTVTVPQLVAGSNVPVAVITPAGISNLLTTLTITGAGQTKLATPVMNQPTVTSTSIRQSWNAVAGATGYSIQLGTASPVALGNVLELLTTGLNPLTAQSAKVQAYDISGAKTVSDYSVPVTGTTTAATLPKPTVGLMANAASTTALSVTLTPIVNATAYQLFASPTQNGNYTALGSPMTRPPYIDEGLVAGQQKWYKWQALGNGTSYLDSPLSDSFSGTTQAQGYAPANPDNNLQYLVGNNLGGYSFESTDGSEANDYEVLFTF